MLAQPFSVHALLPSVTSMKAAGLALAIVYSNGFRKPRGLPFWARDSELRRPTRPACDVRMANEAAEKC